MENKCYSVKFMYAFYMHQSPIGILVFSKLKYSKTEVYSNVYKQILWFSFEKRIKTFDRSDRLWGVSV